MDVQGGPCLPQQTAFPQWSCMLGQAMRSEAYLIREALCWPILRAGCGELGWHVQKHVRPGAQKRSIACCMRFIRECKPLDNVSVLRVRVRSFDCQHVQGTTGNACYVCGMAVQILLCMLSEEGSRPRQSRHHLIFLVQDLRQIVCASSVNVTRLGGCAVAGGSIAAAD